MLLQEDGKAQSSDDDLTNEKAEEMLRKDLSNSSRQGRGGAEVGGSGRINRGADAQVECARGGEGRDKGAGAGAGQKRAAPPSARVFAVMPAEKRARDDHGSGSVASDDAGATAHRDLRAALDVQGVERY